MLETKHKRVIILSKQVIISILSCTSLFLYSCLPQTKTPTLVTPQPTQQNLNEEGENTTPSTESKPIPITLLPEASPTTPSPSGTETPEPNLNDERQKEIMSLTPSVNEVFFNQIGEQIEIQVRALNTDGVSVDVDQLGLVWSTDREDLLSVSQSGTIISKKREGTGFVFIELPRTDLRVSIPVILRSSSTGGSSSSASGGTTNPTQPSPAPDIDVNHCSENASCILEVFAGTGSPGDSGEFGTPSNAEFNSPHGIHIDEISDDIYIADSFNHKIREILNGSSISTIAGSGVNGFNLETGTPTNVLLNFPNSVTRGGTENAIYFSDKANNRIRKLDVSNNLIETIGGGGDLVENDISATSARLSFPLGLKTKGDELYFCDSLNHQVRKIDLNTGMIANVAGNFSFGDSGDGGAASAARLDTPHDIVFDAEENNLYIADTFNHKIRKVDLATGNISTVAGNGTAGYSGDNGPAIQAQLNNPTGIDINSEGHLFIADSENKVIRRIDLVSGEITTIAGGGDSSSNLAINSSFGLPFALAIDFKDDIYVVDTIDNQIKVIR